MLSFWKMSPPYLSPGGGHWASKVKLLVLCFDLMIVGTRRGFWCFVLAWMSVIFGQHGQILFSRKTSPPYFEHAERRCFGSLSLFDWPCALNSMGRLFDFRKKCLPLPCVCWLRLSEGVWSFGLVWVTACFKQHVQVLFLEKKTSLPFLAHFV